MFVRLYQFKKTNLVQIIMCELHPVDGNFVSNNDSTIKIIIISVK